MSDSADCLIANPLAAQHYADGMIHDHVQVVEHVQLARDTFRLRLKCSEVARRIVPGQFVMLRLAGSNDPLLGRPLALYDAYLSSVGQPAGIDVVYLVVGRMTARLAAVRPGDELELWGPLGNGFAAEPTDHLIMVAGGIGQTPFLALGREYLGGRSYGGDSARQAASAKRVTLCYGVRTAELLAGANDFTAAGIELKISSDDGSIGRRGFVTELLAETLQEHEDLGRCRIACCGPEPMMEAVAKIAQAEHVACEVSLETPMACGIGICFSCVAKVRQSNGDWDYKRTCVDGPVFSSERIVW